MKNLGLLPALEESGIKTASLNFYNLHGNPIVSEPRGEDAGYLVPQFSIHRGTLHHILLTAVRERLGKNHVHVSHSLASFTQDENTITAQFTSRHGTPVHSTFTASMLIAADGINSKVRSLLYPNEGPPNFSGRLLWRGVTEREPYMDGRSMIWAGHADQKFIAYPVGRQAQLRGKSLVNWIAELRVRSADDPDKTPPVADWGKSVPKSRFDKQFQNWTFGFLSIPELIADTKADEVYEFPMCDRDPVDKWSFGRLTLLGDAAHPLYPIGSNGATQAILDAVALSAALQANKSIPEALTAYQNERLPPTAKICFANRGNGPDHVLQLAHEKCPDGFENIDDVISKEEIESVGRVYKMLAGFDIETVNKNAKATEGLAERRGLKSPVLQEHEK